MFLAKIRFLLVLLFLGLGIWLHVVEGIGAAWFLYVAAFILLMTHFLFSNVSAAFIALRKGNIDNAEELIYRIKKPEWLLKQHRAYYHFTKGMIALQRNSSQEAKFDLREALNLGLRTSTDKALATLNLANLAFKDKDLELTRKLVAETESYNANDLMIKEHIGKLKNLIG